MLVALLLCTQTVAAPLASGDVLAELIAKTSELKSFTAIYDVRVVNTGEALATAKPNQTRIDYQAPDKVHVDMSVGSAHVSQWLVGGVFTFRCEGEESMHARVDTAALATEFAPIYHILQEAFPQLDAPTDEQRAVIYMRWSFNDLTQKADINLLACMEHAVCTPLGWLTDLRTTGRKYSVKGEQLVLDSDEHFKVAISKTTGLIETLESTSPNGQMCFQLKSLERDAAVDSQLFIAPSTPPAGDDISDALRKKLITYDVKQLRESIYRRIAAKPGDVWDDTQRPKITAVVRAFHEYSMKGAFEELPKWGREYGDKVATWLQQRLDDGHSDEELAGDRDSTIAKLEESLDKRISGYCERLTVPASSTPLLSGEELLKLEREVATKAFDETVRAPIVHDFEHATQLKRE